MRLKHAVALGHEVWGPNVKMPPVAGCKQPSHRFLQRFSGPGQEARHLNGPIWASREFVVLPLEIGDRAIG